MRILSIIAMVFFLQGATSAQEQKILFIGNSYTYVNDLPQTLKDLTSSTGRLIVTDQSTPGGYRLLNHATNTTTIDKIFSQQWDYVVLQAQSQEPSWPPSQLETEVFPYAKQLSDSIKKNRACSEILFYSTWGRQNGDDMNCDEWPPVCTFEGMNDRLTVGYYTMAEQNDASVAPVGLAWKVAREDGLFNSINYYSSDGSHPSVYGTYLTACVFYNSIFKKPIENANYYSSLTEDEALYLQSVANSVFDDSFEYFLSDTITNQDYTFNRAAWYENGVSVLSNFDYNLNALEITLSNTSINGENYFWSFGDLSESNEFEPVHTYSTTGQYNVKLITFGQCGVDTTIKTIDLSTSISNVKNFDNIGVWTKNSQVFFKNLDEISNIKIYDIKGNSLAELEVMDKQEFVYQLEKEYSVILICFTNKDRKIFTKKIVL